MKHHKLALSRMINTLSNNTIECKKLATIVSGQKTRHFRNTTLQEKTGKHECRNVTTTFIMLYNLICISALVLTCFRLTKGRAPFFRPETIVADFLHLMVFVMFNHAHLIFHFTS